MTACVTSRLIGGDYTPRCGPARVLVASFWGCVIVLLATYNAKLYTFLAMEERKLPFTTLAGALKARDVGFYVAGTEVGRSLFEVRCQQIIIMVIKSHCFVSLAFSVQIECDLGGNNLWESFDSYRANNAMKVTSNGNVFRVTGPLWGEPPVTDRFPSQRPATRSFDIFFDLRLNKRIRNNRDAGDLRRHRAHYDVTVTKVQLKVAHT